MKKFLGAICAMATGALAFVFLSISTLFMKYSMGGFSESDSSNAWDIITGGPANDASGDLLRVSLIVILVVACLLVLWGLLVLFKNLGILKIKANLSLVTNLLLTLFTLFVVLALIGALVYCSKVTVPGRTSTAGVGIYLNLVVGLAACVLCWIFARKDVK